MAIVKVGTYRNPPEDITDYEAIIAHLNAYTRQIGNQGMILTEWTNTTTAPKIAMGSYISHGGVLYVVDTEDYALPALSSDGTYYIRVAVSGETLALDYITNLTGYVWNAIYNGLYHPDGKQVLPYQVVKSGALVEKWKITNLMQGGGFSRVRYDGVVKCESLAVTGAISGESLNTGSGAVKLYPLIFESVSVTATSASATVTISPLIIGQEVLVTATLTAANNYDAYVVLPSGSEKYSLSSGGVVIGGTKISSYSIASGTPATVTRNTLVKRLS